MNLAIDAGGTNLRAQIYKIGLHVESLSAKSSQIGLAAWIATILQAYPSIKTIGISYAGQVNNGYIISAPNITIDEHNIKEYFESRYSVSLSIENDLTCAVLAEAEHYESNNICSLYVGTGLGLGVFEQGRVLRGDSNIAAELGHVPYLKAPFLCGCGRDNCIELFASGSGIQKWITHHNLPCEANLELLRVSDNPLENGISQQFEKALLHAAGTTITLFNPALLVLGGGIIEANPYLVEMIKEQIKECALPQSLNELKIVQSELKDAPLAGALLLKEYHV